MVQRAVATMSIANTPQGVATGSQFDMPTVVAVCYIVPCPHTTIFLRPHCASARAGGRWYLSGVDAVRTPSMNFHALHRTPFYKNNKSAGTRGRRIFTGNLVYPAFVTLTLVSDASSLKCVVQPGSDFRVTYS